MKSTEQNHSEYPKGAQLNSAGHDVFNRLGHRFAVASTGLLTAFALGLGFRLQGSTFDQRRYLPRCRTKGFLTSANFESKLAVRALMSAKN
jgi:hypothetical protein